MRSWISTLWNKFNKKYLDEELPIRYRAFNIVLALGFIIGIVTGTITFLVHPFEKDSVLIIAMVISFLVVFFIANDTKGYRMAMTVSCVAMNLVFFPLMFFTGGGFDSGMPIWFALAIIFTFIFMEGKPKYVLLVISVIVYIGIVVVSYYHPDMVVLFNDRYSSFVDKTQSFITVGIGAGMLFNYQERCYNREKKKAEKAQKEAERASQFKSEFLANMSHEIRTPMNVIIGMSEIMLQGELPKETKTNVENILLSSKNLLGIINDILDFSKIESGKMEIIPINYKIAEIIKDITNMMRYKIMDKDIEINLDIEPTLPNILNGDSIRLNQVIINLLSNAVKYTEKGFITLKMSWEKCADDVALLSITVADTGIGIKEEDMDKLFDSFQRVDMIKNRSVEGTGLGLAITKRIMDLMGGEITVESQYGEGTTFVVQIPQKIIDERPYSCTIGEIEEKKENCRFILPQAKILIVDDNEMNLKVMEGLLRPYEVQADFVSSGLECLKKVKETKYHLIFLDHMMPEMDGLETFDRLRLNPEFNTPVVALTANAIQGVKEQYLKVGFCSYVSKPIKVKVLNETLRKFLKDYIVEKEDVTEQGRNRIEVEESNLLNRYLENHGINTKIALYYLDNNVEQYKKLLRLFAKEKNEKQQRLLKMQKSGDLSNYAILLHALKSNANALGAEKLAQEAGLHEENGKLENIQFVRENWGKLLGEWDDVVTKFETYLENGTEFIEKENVEISDIHSEKTEELLSKAEDFLEQFEAQEAMQILQQILKCEITQELRNKVEKSIEKADNFNYEEAIAILKE